MKMEEARRIIEHGIKKQGFIVHFEAKNGKFLTSDWFPEPHAGEELIDTEEEAWEIARAFAANTVGKCINIYVADAEFSPVEGYAAKKIENRE